jgi:SMC interacting uncharacterized protein involved in chromosome segregation
LHLVPLAVTLGEAFGELWPIITTLGGGYAALLGMIWKMMQDRVEDKKEDIRILREENQKLRDTIEKFNIPIAAIADTTRETSRTLERALDQIMPRGGKA